MSNKTFSFFSSTRALEGRIDEFLDTISEGGLAFQRGIDGYLEERPESAEAKLVQLTELESRADQLRRSIETTLYTEMLIPESRGDVLNLLGDLDILIDGFKADLLGFIVEQPEVPAEYRDDLSELVKVVIESCEHTVRAARSFFRDAPTVRDHIHKIGFYEKESDAIALRLRKAVFASSLPLSRKMHLRDMIQLISSLADAAEDCGDRLIIYAIKRTL